MGKSSYMNATKITLNFQWTLRAGKRSWVEWMEELRQYKAEHGHVNVPYKDESNLSLGSCVNDQRSKYRLYQSEKSKGGGGNGKVWGGGICMECSTKTGLISVMNIQSSALSMAAVSLLFIFQGLTESGPSDIHMKLNILKSVLAASRCSYRRNHSYPHQLIDTKLNEISLFISTAIVLFQRLYKNNLSNKTQNENLQLYSHISHMTSFSFTAVSFLTPNSYSC